MGRAYRYQRRLTHIVLAVAEREAAHGMVTKVEEPPAAGQTRPAAQKVSKAAKAAPQKASKAKAEAPKAATKAKAEEHKTTKAKSDAPKVATKATKKKAGK
jgi:large subunit ribosomal protein L22